MLVSSIRKGEAKLDTHPSKKNLNLDHFGVERSAGVTIL
jgi:hypothetical protein